MLVLGFVNYVLLALFGFAHGRPAPVATDGQVDTNLTVTFEHQLDLPSLSKRGCKWVGVPGTIFGGQWVCDNHHLSVGDIVKVMQDVPSGGGASPDAHAFFYTNLRYPYNDENPGAKQPFEIHIHWILGWFRAKGIDHTYGILNAVPQFWRSQQQVNLNHIGYNNFDEADLDYDKTKMLPLKTMPDAFRIFDMCFMQALAAAVINPDVYLFTTKGKDWDKVSYWAVVEYWKLTHNKNVQRIWRVDPTPPRPAPPTPQNPQSPQNPQNPQDPQNPAACKPPKIAEAELLWDRSKDEERSPFWVCPVKEPSAEKPEPEDSDSEESDPGEPPPQGPPQK